MQLLGGIVTLTVIGVFVGYFIHNRLDRAKLWRKASCYCGARAFALETMDDKYKAYLKETGVE